MSKKTIKQHRVLKGLSQESVASEIGISREHLGRIESDLELLRKTKIQTILDLASLYECSVDEITFF